MSFNAAGAFDVRNIIGALIGAYGAILIIASLVMDPGINPTTGAEKNSDYNLYSGLAMLVVGLGFFAWSKLRPITVPEEQEDQS